MVLIVFENCVYISELVLTFLRTMVICQDLLFDFLRAFFGDRYLRTALRTSFWLSGSITDNHPTLVVTSVCPVPSLEGFDHGQFLSERDCYEEGLGWFFNFVRTKRTSRSRFLKIKDELKSFGKV